jgi:hypothetical protein
VTFKVPPCLGRDLGWGKKLELNNPAQMGDLGGIKSNKAIAIMPLFRKLLFLMVGVKYKLIFLSEIIIICS